jgi:hypothetical protein
VRSKRATVKNVMATKLPEKECEADATKKDGRSERSLGQEGRKEGKTLHDLRLERMK